MRWISSARVSSSGFIIYSMGYVGIYSCLFSFGFSSELHTNILLKKRTPITINTNPRSFLTEKVSWPKPGYKRKNTQTVIMRVYSAMFLFTAVEYFVTLVPKPLNTAQLITKRIIKFMSIGFDMIYWCNVSKSSICPLLH